MVTCEFRHSLITPAYNRASWLSGLYAHLLELEYASKDFEWIIIDDGSQDATPRIVSGFIAEGRLNIRYVRQENATLDRRIWASTSLKIGLSNSHEGVS